MSYVPPDLPSWADVKVYIGGRYTWVKPPWAKMVYINAYGRGGGGGSGFTRTSGTGGGGGGGSNSNGIYCCLPASAVPDVLDITIPGDNTGVTQFRINSPNALNTLHLVDTAILNGPTGNNGAVGSGGAVTNTYNVFDNSAVAPYGLYYALTSGLQGANGLAGSATGMPADRNVNALSCDGSGQGGAGIGTTLFASRGGTTRPDGGVLTGSGVNTSALHNASIEGGRGPSAQFLGSGSNWSSTVGTNSNSVTATFSGGETVIVAAGITTTNPASTYVVGMSDGTNTYTQISDIVVSNPANEGGIVLFKADNVAAGTYTITGTNVINGSTANGSLIVSYYRYSGLASGPELARASSTQNGTGGIQTDGITCGPLSSAAISTSSPALLFSATYGQVQGSDVQRVYPGSTINRFIEGRSPTNSIRGPHAGDSLVLTSDPVTAKFTVVDTFTQRNTAAVLLPLSGATYETDAQPGNSGTWGWIPGTIVPLLRGGAGGGSSHFGAGGKGGDGAPGCGGGGGGAGNPGGAGGKGGDGLVIIACW